MDTLVFLLAHAHVDDNQWLVLFYDSLRAHMTYSVVDLLQALGSSYNNFCTHQGQTETVRPDCFQGYEIL